MDKRYVAQRGFTLVETLVALALITVISLIVMGALSPWMGFKQKLDNERRLQDVRQGLLALYDAKGMAVEAEGDGSFQGFKNNAATPCTDQLAAFQSNATYFSEAPDQISRDGYANPWCVYVTAAQHEVREGVDLYYRNITLVSTGPNGTLDSTVQADGTPVLGGDDSAVTVSGKELQAAKMRETLRRMNKVGQMYETYFTTRYLANSARDITIYYFSTAYDASGAVASTGAAWSPVGTALSGIGVGPSDSVTPWETSNAIELNNATEASNGTTVRTPASASGAGALPYTALLRARLPSPATSPAYATQVVVGNY